MRIKISFEDVKRLFNYLDYDGEKTISFAEFKLLSEENWRKIDPVARYMEIMKNRLREAEQKIKSRSIVSHNQNLFENKPINKDSPVKAYGQTSSPYQTLQNT